MFTVHLLLKALYGSLWGGHLTQNGEPYTYILSDVGIGFSTGMHRCRCCIKNFIEWMNLWLVGGYLVGLSSWRHLGVVTRLQVN